MKKMIKILVIVLAISLILPFAVETNYGLEPHPDAYSGDLKNYEGRWIINGQSEDDSDWILDIYEGKYYLSNEYQNFSGEIIFTPGNTDYEKPDTLWLDFDPSLGIEIVLENACGGLIDVSGQNLIFVKPGNQVEFEELEEFEKYTREDMVGDWAFEVLTVVVPDFSMTIDVTNDEVMADSLTGDTRLILSFENGIVYEVSEVLETRIPITRYRHMGGGRLYFLKIRNRSRPMSTNSSRRPPCTASCLSTLFPLRRVPSKCLATWC